MVAALAVGVARGLDLPAVLRLAVAAGALNVTRRGLGSGQSRDIERLAEGVQVRKLDARALNPSAPRSRATA